MSSIGTEELERLYAQFAPVVHRRALRMLGREADAWDAVQEVFRSLLESESEFRGEARPMTYVYRATINVCLNLLRARAIREPVAAVFASEASLSFDHAADAREILMVLARTLDQRSLQVFSLHYMDGLTHEEIAEVLGVSRKTVGRDLDAIREAARSLAHTPAQSAG